MELEMIVGLGLCKLGAAAAIFGGYKLRKVMKPPAPISLLYNDIWKLKTGRFIFLILAGLTAIGIGLRIVF